MGGTIEISEVGMTVNMAGGGKIVVGNWGDGPVNTAAARPPLPRKRSFMVVGSVFYLMAGKI